MKTKLLGVLAGVPMLAFASLAAAEETKPVALDAQALDGVTAAGSAIALANADSIGLAVATTTATLASVNVLEVYPTEAGQLSFIESLSSAAAASISE